jgi:DNA-directed RNA polymerase I, II, and III subunit RPABC2
MSDNEDYNIEDSDVDKKDDDEKTIDDVLSGDDDSDSDSDGNSENNVADDDEEIDESDKEDDASYGDDDDVDEDASVDDNENDDVFYGGAQSEGKKPSKKKANAVAAEQPEGFQQNIYISDEDDDDDDDENYLQKFDKEINHNYILEHHPECVNHNYDEIIALAKIVRDKDGNIVDPFHRTIPFLTKFEKARVLGQRAKQIEAGARPFVEVPDKIIEGNIIALLEMQQKRLPFIIRRPLPCGGSEYWHLHDLDMIDF